MLRALSSGVSGLKTHQTKMDVIGNNIANVNTYGFKASRVSFKDAYYQTLTGSSDANDISGGGNPSQVGYGSVLNTIDVLHIRGGYTPTGEPMDLFISGEGYFVARDGNGNERYTRTGILGFDGEGNLVDGNKNYICGYPVARYTDPVAAKAAALDIEGGFTVDFGGVNAAYFNGFKIQFKQNDPATGADAAAEADLTNKIITVSSDGLLNAADLQQALRGLTADADTGTLPAYITDNLGAITVENADAAATVPGFDTVSGVAKGGEKAHNVGEVMFETLPPHAAGLTVNNVSIDFGTDNGAFFNGFKIKTAVDAAAAGTRAEANLTDKVITITSKDTPIKIEDIQAALQSMTASSGTLPNNVDPKLITVSGNATLETGVTSAKASNGENVRQQTILDKSNGLQQIGKPGNLIDTDGDGAYDQEMNDVMTLVNISIGEDGIIAGEDGNGNILQIGQIVLANIPNPQALTMDGNSYMNAVNNAGDVTYAIPGEGGTGKLVSGGLEGSNVDLANEFADMITTQRGFQANSRIITVGDEMLQELINLKR